MDACFRIHAPVTLAPDDRHPVSTFLVTEIGLSSKPRSTAFAPMQTPTSRQAAASSPPPAGRGTGWPKRISRQKHIHVIPHGVAGDIFRPLPSDERAQLRQQFGISPDEVVFLNVCRADLEQGPGYPDTGLCAMLSQAPAHTAYRQGSGGRYTASAARKPFSRELHALGHSGNNALVGAIRIVSGDLSLPQLRELYCLADYYLSPYRAEGFNLPVIEAIACGTPAIVTQGGATDDFCDDSNSLFIDATPQRNVIINDQRVTYQAPSPEAPARADGSLRPGARIHSRAAPTQRRSHRSSFYLGKCGRTPSHTYSSARPESHP